MNPGPLRRFLAQYRSRLLPAVRGCVSALAALFVAAHLQLECPFWAGMTALIVIQPTRGLLLEKGCYRLMGTALGCAGGLLMLQLSPSPALLTILLTCWIAACVGIGNLLYGLRSYAVLVAALTGAVIVMLGYSDPQHLDRLVFSRVACIVIGIIVSTTVSLFFPGGSSRSEILERLAQVIAQGVCWTAAVLRGEDTGSLKAHRERILVEIAGIEATLDAVWAGSLDLKKRRRRARSALVSLLSLIEAGTLWEPPCGRAEWRNALAGSLDRLGHALGDGNGGVAEGEKCLLALTQLQAAVPSVAEPVRELLASLRLLEDSALDAERVGATACRRFIRHRDWIEAGRAALRAASAIAAVGLLWRVTGWGEGPSMVMTAAIMVSIFSTHDRPAQLLAHILAGASVGVAAAVFCRLVLLPDVGGLLLQGAVCLPVLFAGMLALGHKRCALGAMDAMLFFLFVMQPGTPMVPRADLLMLNALASLAGVAVAIFAFRHLLPVDPARRLGSLLVALAHDLKCMADAVSPAVRARCRARTQHRVLRMLVHAAKAEEDLSSIVEGGLAALAIGRSLEGVDECSSFQATRRGVRRTLRRLTSARRKPRRILTTLKRVAANAASRPRQ